MAKFKVYAKQRLSKQEIVLYYDNMTSILTWEDGTKVIDQPSQQNGYGKITKNNNWPVAQITTPEKPLGKTNKIKTLKIQLGLSCNYSCDYCSQRFVPHADESSFKYVDKFVANIDKWVEGEPENIEFWGGEPLVYIKTIKPLAEKLREKFPNSKFGMITNGSLLSPEINEWIDKMGFGISISHDGPGQPLRGPDPLEDPVQRANIVDLIKRLHPQGRISINSMLNRENFDRGAIQKHFAEFYESIGIRDFQIGEGAIIDPYDEGGLEHSLQTREEHLGYRRLTLDQTSKMKNRKFGIVSGRIGEMISSISTERPASSLGQKCGMDSIDTIAVDLRGNVITCQNVSAVATAPNGRQHMLGHVSRMDQVKLNTSTHWSARKECVDCPVLQTCKGACMYLQGNLWTKACDNAFTDHIPFWAFAIENLTGFLPYYIEHENLPEDRKNIWGDKEEKAVVPKVRSNITKLNDEINIQ